MRHILRDLYHNYTEKGGKSSIDEMVMVKVLFLMDRLIYQMKNYKRDG
ncbi:MAG: hypothetical protein QXX23_00600 [Thermoplasmata archaeon]